MSDTTTILPATRIEQLLGAFAPQLGSDATAYGNHVRRVFWLVAAQATWSAEALDQAAIAAVFHDIGIWSDGTFDYLEPSRGHAHAYLREEGLTAWKPIIDALIMEHHKLRPVADQPLVEAFRRADLCDLSFGAINLKIPRATYRGLVREFPIRGFHGRLARFALDQARKDPRRPLPMIRW